MQNLPKEFLLAVKKKAEGYKTEECVEEYGVNEGQLTLCKRKVTLKEVPPDVSALKMLMEISGGDEYETMSEDELQKEKERLLKLLKEKENETNQHSV